MCSINEWGVTKMLYVFIPSQCFVINSMYHMFQHICNKILCEVSIFVTWKSIFVFHKLLSCSRQNESYEVYDPQIENYLNRWIITSLVAKDLVFWDLKVKPESCDTICFFSKMTWKEKNDLQERRKKTHDKSKISNLDQAKLFKYDLTKHSIKWIEAWSSIDSIIIIWVVTILRSLKVFQLWSFFHENFSIKHFF